MAHDLAELTSGLASRVNNLAVMETGNNCRTLLEQQDRLAKLAMLAIIKELSAERAEYQAAVKGLNEAIAYIGNADKKISEISKAIELLSKAADLVDKALNA